MRSSTRCTSASRRATASIPGIATAASIIGQAGKPLGVRAAAAAESRVHGWQGLHRHRFPEIGYRWMSDVDVPDLDLFPQHYPELATVRFSAGLEVGLFHLGLWAASWLARAGIVRSLAPLAAPMLAAKRRLSMLGSDTGGMFVRVVGRDQRGHQAHAHLEPRRAQRRWAVRAGDGIGDPRQAARGRRAGRRPAPAPCFGLFQLGDFEAEVGDLDITCWLERD